MAGSMKPSMTGGTFKIGLWASRPVVIEDWFIDTSDATEPWYQDELEGFWRDFQLIQRLPVVAQ